MQSSSRRTFLAEGPMTISRINFERSAHQKRTIVTHLSNPERELPCLIDSATPTCTDETRRRRRRISPSRTTPTHAPTRTTSPDTSTVSRCRGTRRTASVISRRPKRSSTFATSPDAAVRIRGAALPSHRLRTGRRCSPDSCVHVGFVCAGGVDAATKNTLQTSGRTV